MARNKRVRKKVEKNIFTNRFSGKPMSRFYKKELIKMIKKAEQIAIRLIREAKVGNF